jgi:hypothetical protein
MITPDIYTNLIEKMIDSSCTTEHFQSVLKYIEHVRGILVRTEVLKEGSAEEWKETMSQKVTRAVQGINSVGEIVPYVPLKVKITPNNRHLAVFLENESKERENCESFSTKDVLEIIAKWHNQQIVR